MEKDILASCDKKQSWIRVLFVIICCVALYSCEERGRDIASSNGKDWAQEEILQQLSELRREVKTLKDEVASLQSQIQGAGRAGLAVGSRSVRLNAGTALGDATADIAIIEFTDYQCPYCARHNGSVMPAIKEKLIETGKARYVTYDFPLDFHRQAEGAAVAARCAGQQGKFWDMHALLFANQQSLGSGFFSKAAGDLQLDTDQFQQCLQDPGVLASVQADKQYGNEIGVTGTPKFYIGKVRDDVITDVIEINGAQGYAAFSNAIERLEKI